MRARVTVPASLPAPGGAVAGGGRPVVLILLAMLAFALQDVVVKLIAAEVSLWQLQAVRSLAVLVFLAGGAALAGRRALLRPGPPFWPLLRAGFMSASYLLFYASLPMLTLSQAASAFFVGPMIITLLAAVLLGEPIGPRRIAAVLLGFLGVLVILRPWGALWQPWLLMPLGAAFAYATGIVLTRWRCHDRPGTALATVHNGLYAVIGIAGVALVPLLPLDPATRAALPFLTSGWLPVGALAVALMLATALGHLFGVLASIRAYQGEEAGRLAPFEYSYLAVAPLFDIAIWGIVPARETLAGMALIMLGGSFVAWRDGRGARPLIVPRGKPPVDAAR